MVRHELKLYRRVRRREEDGIERVVERKKKKNEEEEEIRERDFLILEVGIFDFD